MTCYFDSDFAAGFDSDFVSALASDFDSDLDSDFESLLSDFSEDDSDDPPDLLSGADALDEPFA
jgi:hypothetical protein